MTADPANLPDPQNASVLDQVLNDAVAEPLLELRGVRAAYGPVLFRPGCSSSTPLPSLPAQRRRTISAATWSQT